MAEDHRRAINGRKVKLISDVSQSARRQPVSNLQIVTYRTLIS